MKKDNFISKALLLSALLALLMPVTSYADCCPGTVPAINNVRAAVELTRNSIVSAISKNTQAITQQLVANNQSANKAIKDQTQVIEELAKRFIVAQSAIQTQRDFGTSGEVNVNGKTVRLTAQSPSLCDQIKLAKQLAKAQQDLVNARSIIKESGRKHNEDFPSTNESSDRLRKLTRKEFDVEWLNKNILEEDDVAAAVESIKNITNPIPLPKLKEQHKDTPQGKSYLASRALINQKHSITQQILSEQLLMRSPLIEEEDGTKSSILGKMENRILTTIEDDRENPWIEELERKSTAPLLRELNISIAHLYKAQFETLKSQQNLNALMSGFVSSENRQRGLAAYKEFQRTLRTDDDR